MKNKGYRITLFLMTAISGIILGIAGGISFYNDEDALGAVLSLCGGAVFILAIAYGLSNVQKVER